MKRLTVAFVLLAFGVTTIASANVLPYSDDGTSNTPNDPEQVCQCLPIKHKPSGELRAQPEGIAKRVLQWLDGVLNIVIAVPDHRYTDDCEGPICDTLE